MALDAALDVGGRNPLDLAFKALCELAPVGDAVKVTDLQATLAT